MQVVADSYWDAFYASRATAVPDNPSQFAAFVLNEVPDARGIIDFGCGTGRDSLFFSRYGRAVLGLDSSREAVAFCRSRGLADADFAEWPGEEAEGLLQSFLEARRPVLFYARFLLHAVDEHEEDELLATFAGKLPPGSHFAFEYRTVRDGRSEKAFGNHFRRFLDHPTFLRKLSPLGLTVLYETEGNGLAKYRTEDALVGRCLAIRAG